MLCKHKTCLSAVVIIKGKSALFAVIKLWPVTGSLWGFFSCHFFFIVLNVWTSNSSRAERCLAQLPKGAKQNFIWTTASLWNWKEFFFIFLYSPRSTFCAYSLHAPKVTFTHPACPMRLDTGQGVLHLLIKWAVCALVLNQHWMVLTPEVFATNNNENAPRRNLPFPQRP